MEPLSRSVETGLDHFDSGPEDDRHLDMRELLEGCQEKDFSIGVGQRGHRFADRGQLQPMLGIPGGTVERDGRGQDRGAPRGPLVPLVHFPLVGQDPACHRVDPSDRVVGAEQIVESSPGDQKCVCPC